MELFEPRSRLPDEWARKAACPVCQVVGLTVNYVDGCPDRMVCPVCRVSFEIAQDFTHMRIIGLPVQPIAHRIDLIGAWLTPVELRAIVDQPLTSNRLTEPIKKPWVKPTTGELKSILSSLPKLTQEEVNKRVANLASLRNSTESIRQILERAGATPMQIQRSLDDLARRRQKQIARQKTSLYILAGLALLAILAFAAYVVFGGGAFPG